MAKCIPAITKLFLARCRGEPAIITREHTKPLIATYQLFTVRPEAVDFTDIYIGGGVQNSSSDLKHTHDAHTHVDGS